MEIGSKIKLLRLKYNLTQEELADRCELSKGFISQVENDLTSPSIETLDDIVTTLGGTLKQFFTDESNDKVVFGASDYSKKQTDSSILTWLVTNSQKNEMEPMMVELFEGSETDKDMPHEGEEFGYILQGKITLYLGKNEYECKKGDSFYYVADRVHYIKNKMSTNAKFIWVSSPPNF